MLPARQQLGDLGPLIAPLLVSVVYDAVLLLGPSCLLDVGVQVVVPSLATLLAYPALEVSRDQRPLLRPVLVYQLHYRLVLLWSKRTNHLKSTVSRHKEVNSSLVKSKALFIYNNIMHIVQRKRVKYIENIACL